MNMFTFMEPENSIALAKNLTFTYDLSDTAHLNVKWLAVLQVE